MKRVSKLVIYGLVIVGIAIAIIFSDVDPLPSWATATSQQTQTEEQWSPQGAARSASDASRVLVRQHLRWYGDELISNRPSRYSQSEQMQILDNHSFFTGVCPECGHQFERSNPPIHYDCPECPKGYRFAYDFIDDSVERSPEKAV